MNSGPDNLRGGRSPRRLVQPRTLKGFRDYPPEAMMPRERLIETARRVYRSYGFRPIDTPALEYLEILRGKGGEEADRQIYEFEDHGGRQVGLRFDLTVPLARFAAQHIAKLGAPFKRYQIAAVWRGENTQRGRYREFIQCDFDAVGTTSAASDIETALVIHDLMQALGFSQFAIHINNRQVLNGLLERLGLEDRAAAVLRALDKLAKIGPQKVTREMEEAAGASPGQASQVLELAELAGPGEAVLGRLEAMVRSSEQGRRGAERLRQVLDGVRAAGAPIERFRLDASIARGLDYYTGVVFETFLSELPGIGSVCSGGRYDDLAGLYTKQTLPGVGASLGLDRLLAAMDELGMIETTPAAADVFVAYFDKDRLNEYLRLAAQVRAAGLSVELYPEPRRLGQQLQYADRRGCRVALIAGENELAENQCQVKDMQTGRRENAPLEPDAARVIELVRRVLAGGRERPGGQRSDDPEREGP